MLAIKEGAPHIGIVLGIVFLMIGINYTSFGLWILGLALLGVSLLIRLKKG